MKKHGLLIVMVMALLVVTGTAGINAAPGPVSLTLWGGYPEVAPFYKAVIADYEKQNPNVKITFLTHPLREYEQKLSAAIPSNSAADIMECDTYSMSKFIEAGLVNPNPSNVNKFLRNKKNYGQFFVNYNTIKGKTYGVPFFQGREVLFWNKQMFKEAGLTRAPKTFSEVITDAKKLTKYDSNGNLLRAGIGLRKSGGGQGVAEKWWFWLYSAGGDIVKQVAPGKYCNGYNNKAGQDALKLYIDLIYKYKTDSFKLKADAEGFELEKSAMFTRESWVVGDIKAHAPNLDYDTAPMPSDKRGGTVCNMVNFYVAKSSKNPQAAWNFALFMLKPEYQKMLLSQVGWFPCRSGNYEDIFKQVPQYRSFVELPKGYKLYAYPRLACMDEIMTKLAERLGGWFMDSSLVNNPKKIKACINAAAQETDNILKENGVYTKK
jgi:multiple sugar transport system substrate-binding protein